MKLGTEVGLGPGHIVLDGDRAPLPKKRAQLPPLFGPCLLWPNGSMDKMPLGMEVGLGPGHIVLDGTLLPPKGHNPQFLAHVCCSQTAGWIKLPLDTEVGLGAGDIMLDGGPSSQ